VRIAAAADRESLLQLVTSAFAYGAGARGTAHRLAALPNDPEGLVEVMLADNDVVALIGDVDGVTSGFALLLTGPPRLVAIFVSPAARRRGLGRALVGHAETLAVASKGDQLTAVAGAGNRAEKSLYEALGYRAELLMMAARRG
jgi:ribosomal protein S18 acetylase RimI-like enzyme